MGVANHQRMLRFSFTSLCDWSGKSWATLSTSQTNRYLGLRAFSCPSGDLLVGFPCNYFVFVLRQSIEKLSSRVPLSIAIFNWVSKVIWDWIGFAFLRSMIGPENSRHLLNQSDANHKPTWSFSFSRASARLFSHFVLIGSWWYFVCSDWSSWLLGLVWCYSIAKRYIEVIIS